MIDFGFVVSKILLVLVFAAAAAAAAGLLQIERKWVLPFRNFDNIFTALRTLFIIVTLDGYFQIVHCCMDIVGVDMVPKVRGEEVLLAACWPAGGGGQELIRGHVG